MSSAAPENPETFAAAAAAHPTAVKAGGMRIVQDKSHLLRKKTEAPVAKPEDETLNVTASPPKQSDLMSGATSGGNSDFPAAAVRSFHDKPHPTRDHQNSHKPTVIQQPKK